MKRQLKLAGLAVLLSVAAHPAVAQEKLKIGIIVTLSGPAAVLGQQVRDGFALAVKDLGGKVGGRDVDVVEVPDRVGDAVRRHRDRIAIQDGLAHEANGRGPGTQASRWHWPRW